MAPRAPVSLSPTWSLFTGQEHMRTAASPAAQPRPKTCLTPCFRPTGSDSTTKPRHPISACQGP
ncbi:uncharacterized protein BDZ83DRAFT_635751 [Colletotrichum acutatum]|uniref:Uncharacterized protein n=1 Tax=Glomerella acutata TaxID=27357 RepID=A0AAD8XBL3_GLOAC|nr:uncharacterized protein BDZ83DRAFT_635751 [Colletotrichum acutatum]KAK1715512.1 hypothetical protein BDZ83DRAFT_635751 [Colletotrichum acutatum]